MFDFMARAMWALLSYGISVAATVLDALLGYMGFGSLFDGATEFYTANLSGYVRTGSSLFNVVAESDAVAAWVVLTGANVLICLALRVTLWVYHQFWGAN